VVYRARDTRLERDVALKVLPEGALADEAARKRFRKEALALSQLNHPNIATVHDFDTQDGVDFLVLEYIPGVTLSDRLAESPLSEKELLRLGVQMAEGLAAAHEQGVVHRDLKPANLRVTPDGRLKILDFGLATLRRPQGDPEAASTATVVGGVAGTLPYMSPEQLRAETVDARSDIYAAGAVLYEMATGRRCFPQSGSTELIAAILQQPAPALPGAVGNIVAKCLDKEAERRYQGARELRVDLDRLAAPPSAHAAARPRAAGSRRWLLGVVAVLVAVGAGLGWWLTRGAAPPDRIESIAVLPLENLSGDATQDYFADGMTEALTTDLGKIGALRVIARQSVMKFKGTRTPLAEVAGQLKVQALVVGSVMRSGEQVRISAQLYDPRTDRQLWSESYERGLRDILALQREVARAIAGEVRVKLTPPEQERLAKAGRVRPEAYELYLKARALSGRANEPDIRQAITLLERAVGMDADFAPAHAALAMSYGNQILFVSPDQSRPLEQKARAALDRATALEPDLAEAYVVRANLMLPPRIQWVEAVPELRKALSINPNSDEAHSLLARAYVHLGFFEEGRAAALKALEISPGDALARLHVAEGLQWSGRLDEAHRAWLDTPVDALPSVVRAQRAWILIELGRMDEARARLAEFVRDDSEDTGGVLAGVQAFLEAAAGGESKAEDLIRRSAAKAGYGHSHHAAYYIACAYAKMNKPRPAVQWLEKAAETGFPCYPLFMRDPRLDPLRKDPGFVAFMDKQKQQWERDKAMLFP